MKLEFKPEFIDEIICEFSMNRMHAFTEKDLDYLALSVMNRCNARLAEMLKGTPVVHINKLGFPQWPQSSDGSETHSARLVNIEEIGK